MPRHGDQTAVLALELDVPDARVVDTRLQPAQADQGVHHRVGEPDLVFYIAGRHPCRDPVAGPGCHHAHQQGSSELAAGAWVGDRVGL